MRKLIVPLLTAVVFLTGCHFALPFWTALEIKRAIRTGDAATIESRVEWDSVRSSLRESLHQQAPQEAGRKFGRIPIIQKYVERIAVNYSRPVVDKMVESFGTADGLVRFFSWRETLSTGSLGSTYREECEPFTHFEPTRELERQDLRRKVDEALAQLPAAQRQTFVLHAEAELSYREVAEVLGISIGTVMSRLYYARQRLRVLLEPWIKPQ